MRELPPDLAEEVLAAVREVCRADGTLSRAESRALDALARRLAVTVDPEEEFFRRTSPRELAERVAAILGRQDGGSRLDADHVAERLASMAEEAAAADGSFAREEREALAAFVAALDRLSAR